MEIKDRQMRDIIDSVLSKKEIGRGNGMKDKVMCEWVKILSLCTFYDFTTFLI